VAGSIRAASAKVGGMRNGVHRQKEAPVRLNNPLRQGRHRSEQASSQIAEAPRVSAAAVGASAARPSPAGLRRARRGAPARRPACSRSPRTVQERRFVSSHPRLHEPVTVRRGSRPVMSPGGLAGRPFATIEKRIRRLIRCPDEDPNVDPDHEHSRLYVPIRGGRLVLPAPCRRAWADAGE